MASRDMLFERRGERSAETREEEERNVSALLPPLHKTIRRRNGENRAVEIREYVERKIRG